MKQIEINKNVIPAMPVVLVGTKVNGKENFMAVGWCTRINFQPAMIGIAISNNHLTAKGIIENQEFSVCIPGRKMKEVVDYCGIKSGKNVDKSKLFTVFNGKLANSPLIDECPVNIECKLIQAIEFATNTLFIGEIVGAYACKEVLENNIPQVEKVDPMILTMPDNRYWGFNESVGKAWKDGLAFSDRQAK